MMSRLADRQHGRLSQALGIYDETMALALDIAALRCVEPQEAELARQIAADAELNAMADAATDSYHNEDVV
jgi:hypothetical protein